MNPAEWVSSADRALALAAEHIRVIRAVTPPTREASSRRSRRPFAAGRRACRGGSTTASRSPPSCAGARRSGRVSRRGLAARPHLRGRAREMCLEACDHRRGGDAANSHARRAPVHGRSRPRSCRLTKGRRAGQLVVRPRRARARRSRTTTISFEAATTRILARSSRRCRAKRAVQAPDARRRRAGARVAGGDGRRCDLRRFRAMDSRRDVERTVLHEIAGHALPRARAATAPLGIFAFGTARGIDDQEGRALLIERAAGFLDGSRRRELGLRHLGARATLEGATFVDVVELLLGQRAPIGSAVRIASRVQRGGPGAGGLAREIIYIPSLLRVEDSFRPHGKGGSTRVDDTMAGGRIAADVAPSWQPRSRPRKRGISLGAKARVARRGRRVRRHPLRHVDAGRDGMRLHTSTHLPLHLLFMTVLSPQSRDFTPFTHPSPPFAPTSPLTPGPSSRRRLVSSRRLSGCSIDCPLEAITSSAASSSCSTARAAPAAAPTAPPKRAPQRDQEGRHGSRGGPRRHSAHPAESGRCSARSRARRSGRKQPRRSPSMTVLTLGWTRPCSSRGDRATGVPRPVSIGPDDGMGHPGAYCYDDSHASSAVRAKKPQLT